MRILLVIMTVLLWSTETLAVDVYSRQPGVAGLPELPSGQSDLMFPELPPVVSSASVPLTPKEKAALALQRAYHDRNVPPVLTENGRVTYAFGLTTPSVVCAPFMVSDIEFQEGELVNDVVMGDTARWKVSLARSGSPEVSHLIVKPLDAGLETTTVVTTDRRVYHIQLKSQPKGHMAYVGFVYPEEANQALQQQIAAQQKKETWQTASIPALSGNVDLSRLAFNYEVKGNAPWKPTQVFNDGRQTFIRLPRTVSQSEMPVLLVRRDGGDVLVNYRVKDDTLVVDDLFTEAKLLAGVGRNQQRIDIRRMQ